MNFGMIMQNHNMVKRQNVIIYCVIIVSLHTWKQMVFIEDVETRFDTSNYELDRPLPKEKNKKVIWFMKHE